MKLHGYFWVIFVLCQVVSCSSDGSAFEPFVAPLFDGYDLNPDSISHKTTLKLSEQKGKVTALYFTSYSCSYCRAHYPELYALFRELEASGLYPTKVQLWLMGYPVSGLKVEEFCKGTDPPCFVDRGAGRDSVYSAYKAALGNLILIDSSLWARHKLDLVACPLEKNECSSRLSDLIDSLLERNI